MKSLFLIATLLVTAGFESQQDQPAHVLAIYNPKTNELHRIFIPSFWDEEIVNQFVAPDEAFVVLPIRVYREGGIASVSIAISNRYAYQR